MTIHNSYSFLIEKATPHDKDDFARLMLISAPIFLPTIFGKRALSIFKCLFLKHANLFSMDHVYVVKSEGTVGSMVLFYDWHTKEKEDIRTGLSMFCCMGVDFLARIPLFIKAGSCTGYVRKGEIYISNLATYPKFRGRGMASALIAKVEEEAKKSGGKYLSLDVEVENADAIKLYQRLGFRIIKESSTTLKNRQFFFYRMIKKSNHSSKVYKF